MAYPLPVFFFEVDWGGTLIGFSEVTGMNWEAQIIEYREGSSPEHSMIKMPGIKKYGNITLKRGVMQGDNEYYEWLSTISLNSVERRDITITLKNEEQQPVVVWKVMQAWPTKLTSPDLKASGNEAAIESIEVAHEGITVEMA